MSDFIGQLQRRLVELGCPTAQMRRLVREVADHREDSTQAALLEGASQTDAEARANAVLGDPLELAASLMASLRLSSWWGRHFFVGFCLLPLLTVPVLWVLLLLLDLTLGFALGFGWNYKKLHAAADNPVSFHHLGVALHCADYVAIAMVTLLFCWLARRAAVNVRWMVAACAVCSFYALFIWIHIQPHVFVVGISSNPQWTRGVIPILVACAIYAFQRWTIHNARAKAAVCQA